MAIKKKKKKLVILNNASVKVKWRKKGFEYYGIIWGGVCFAMCAAKFWSPSPAPVPRAQSTGVVMWLSEKVILEWWSLEDQRKKKAKYVNTWKKSEIITKEVIEELK